jgi:hypothetical protein
VAAWLCLLGAPARADNCEALGSWRSAKREQSRPTESISERNRLDQAEWATRQASASQIYALYSRGELHAKALLACLERDTDRGNFLHSLYDAFFQGALDLLRGSRSPAIRGFLREYERKNSGTIPLVRVMGFEEKTPAPMPGGYQRSVKSIYLHFGEIRPNDWTILFVHEILHSLDEQLWEGVDRYGRPEKVSLFASWAERYSTFPSLAPAEQNEMRLWLLAGLDRGLLAEYRAWSATFEIYRQGLTEGLWKSIDWVEAVLASQKPGQSIEAHTFHYLDQRSPDPLEGIFAKPLIQSGLKEARGELRRATPPLHNLRKIVRPE